MKQGLAGSIECFLPDFIGRRLPLESVKVEVIPIPNFNAYKVVVFRGESFREFTLSLARSNQDIALSLDDIARQAVAWIDSIRTDEVIEGLRKEKAEKEMQEREEIVNEDTGEVIEPAVEDQPVQDQDPIVSAYLENKKSFDESMDNLTKWCESATKRDMISELAYWKAQAELANASVRKLRGALLSQMEVNKAKEWLIGPFDLKVSPGAKSYGYRKELIPTLRETVKAEHGDKGEAIFNQACTLEWAVNKTHLNKLTKFGGRTGAIIEAMVQVEKEGEISLTITGPCGIKL